ncbi:MAG TPA: hypothetical protein DCL15_13935 [Chloroflexi bacterium]|nr:hypothetical protein [Chloroflexota bacterium]HHW88779.1 hypothetical protein [Chloroflexota bacterium]
MKRILNLVGGLLGLLVLIGLAVVLAMTFGGLQRAAEPASQAFQSPIETPTQPPYPPPGTPTPPGPAATPTVVPTPVPPCTFAGQPAPVEPGPPFEAYQFSEPRVVLTHTSAIGIAGWLPDGQRLLITRLIPGQPREYIEIFNTQTGELQRYGERHSLPGKPVWLAAHQAVAFVDVGPDKQVVLRISRGETATVETPISDLTGSFLGVSPDGRQLVFFTQASQDRPEVFDLAQPQRATLPAALPLMRWSPYRISWHPQGHQIAFYNETGFYLANLPLGRICEVDLGFEESEARYGKRWTFDVQWSPNGRYLAALTTAGNPPVHFIDLTLIDTNTGELRRLDLGLQYLYAITWAPNSHDLLVIGEKGTNESGLVLHGLYVVNATTSDARQMLADYQFVSIGTWGGAWSPTGQAIALACPVVAPEEQLMIEGRLCIITVGVRR